MNPLGARDSPHPEIVELLTEETSRDTRPSTTEHRNPALGVPRFMRETAATMNRSRMDESHENSAPEQPSRATAPTSQTKETLERRASGLPRAHGKNNLFDRDVRIPGRYPSLGHTDSVQQPLDISDDSDDELPTTITTRKKGVAFIDHRADLSSPLGIRYPLMSEQRRYSRQSQAEVDTDYFSEAWLSPGPAASLEPLVEHAYERAQFERQPSTSYVIPREDNVTTFDLWENDAQGNPQRKDSLHTTPIGHTNNDQSKALNRLYDQIRDMWRDLGNERKHSDQLGEQLLARDKVIENLHSKDQETQDILEGYKGDVADTQAVLKNCQDQLQSSVATVARLTEELRDARGSAHEDYQQAQNQAENLAARKSAYKDKYRQEHDAHRATLENMKKLQAKLKQATAKVSRSARRGHTGPSPPDSSDSEGDDANSPLPALSRQGQRGTQSTKNRYSDDEEYDHRRHPRPKKPEPEAFSGNGTTSADYLKWKMDVTDWFADYPYEFASETKKLSYIRQKTKDKAFGCLQHGYLEPGAEFAHSNEAWSILDSVYKSLNTSIEAQSWYESLNSTMKPTESMGEYIARFNVGTSALRWPDTLKIQFMRNRLPVWWRDMTAMKVLESSLTYLDFCQTLRLLEQSNPQRATTTGNRRGNQSLEGGGGGGAGGNKSTPSNGPRNGGSSSGSGPRGRSDIQVKVLRHLNRCFNCLKKNHTFKATGGYCSKEPVASFDSYPEVQDALEKAIANNGVPVGEPARPKVKGAAASGPPRHEKPPPVQPPAHPLIPPAPSVEDSEEEEELHPNRFVDDSLTLALSPTVEVSSDDESDPDPTLQAIANRVKALKQQSQTGSRITVSAIAAAAIRGDKYQPLVGQQLVFKGIISSHRSSPQHVEIMGDTGCASLFIDSSHARAHKYDLISLSQPATLELADGSLVAGVTHMARVTVTFGTHTEDVLAYVTKLSGVQMILGTPWFQTHEPRVNWKDMSLSFDSEHCLINCIHDHRPCHTQSSRHHKQPLPQVPDPCRKVARHPKAPPPIDVAFISSRVAAAAVCHDQDICITSYDEIGRIAELSDKEWEDTQHLRAAGAKVLPEDYEKFRDKMERPHMTRQEILKRLPKVLHPFYAAVRLAGVCLGDNPCDLGSVLTLMQESGEGASLSTSTMLVGLARFSLKGTHDPYDDIEGADDRPLDDVLLELCLSDPRLRDVKTALASNDRRIPHYLIAEGIRMELADLEASNDGKLFIGNGRLVVPFSEKLRTRIIAHIHNSLPGGHGGRTTTYQQVSQWYYWQGMTNTIARFTNNCLTCKRSKVNRTAKHSLLHPLPVPTQYWDDISIDFITPLPKSTWCGHSYQHIMVVVDRLSKMKKFIAMENLEVPTVVDKFMEYIWKEEGYPRTLVSDRGRQFTSHFWNRLCAQVGTHPKLSTSHHPETDGQTENANADLKQYLRAYVNYLQTDWAQLLPLAEFEANSAISTATGLSPFLATKGRQPRSGLEPAHLLRPLNNHPTIAQQQRNADALAQRIDTTRTFLRQQILWAQDKMKEFADANRYPAPRFDVGDWVMLNARHIKTERPVKSLDHKNIGPYQITRVIDNMAYELDLPPQLKAIFPAFHPWLLQPYEDDALPGQPRPGDAAPPEVHLGNDGVTEYVVSQVLDSRIRRNLVDPHTGERGLLQYKVEWVGDDQSEPWQPYHNLRSCKESVQDFHSRNPGRPGPHATFHDYDDDGQLAIALLQLLDSKYSNKFAPQSEL
ncbi:rve multi-domain protein [Pyrenophora tritici-repentis]|uniref:Rve multi-domain protein n=2 Tax=Pyrenophora tritici-repentis TaxID=45151 RepID=A0A922N4W2_9PLEO|nr:rve multi-domain protein [Pyrenophora tritici-repentis]KAI1683788.1 rve multi-domain protein [Pyrenophora tritici-repentis]